MKKVKHFLARVVVKTVQTLHHSYARIHLYKLKGEFGHIGVNAFIEDPSNVMNPQCISIGDNFTARAGLKLRAYTSWEGTVFDPVLSIGNNVHLATDCTINCTHRIEIHDNTAIGASSKLMDHAHGLPGYEDLGTLVMKRVLTSKGSVVIRENVMIGAGVVVLAGVEIGENSIIGSNSVVTRSIPPNSIAAGIPARVLKTISLPGKLPA
ncbi:MAG: acyltransferase [Chitinophagaceae bacterium]|nr:acyltransferase [Chitinophagaceae bacterium]